MLVEGFSEGVRIRRVVSGMCLAFAIGEAGELFSWGLEWPGISATVTSRTSPRRSASRRCGTCG
jgi:hypothetical protein